MWRYFNRLPTDSALQKLGEIQAALEKRPGRHSQVDVAMTPPIWGEGLMSKTDFLEFFRANPQLNISIEAARNIWGRLVRTALLDESPITMICGRCEQPIQEHSLTSCHEARSEKARLDLTSFTLYLDDFVRKGFRLVGAKGEEALFALRAALTATER